MVFLMGYKMSVLITRQHKSFGRIVRKDVLNVPSRINVDDTSVESVASVDIFFIHEEIGTYEGMLPGLARVEG